MKIIGGWIAVLRIAFVLGWPSLATPAKFVVSGTVRDSTGFGYDGAVVWILTQDCLESRRTVTNNHGSYSFDNLSQSSYQLFATHPGFVQPTLAVVTDDGTGAKVVDLQLLVSGEDTGGAPPSMPLTGIVQDQDGRSIPRVRISYEKRDSALSTESGRFGICRVFGPKVRLRVEHQLFHTRTIHLKFNFGTDYTQDLAIRMKKR